MRFRLVVGALLLVVSCKQEAGDRCQLDGDCAEGLCCIYIGTPNPQTGGQCQPCGSTLQDAAPVDAPIDAPAPDGPDAANDGPADGPSDGASDGAADAMDGPASD